MDSDKIKARPPPLERYAWASAVVWTVIVVASLAWNAAELKGDILELARITARSVYEEDVIYRRWNVLHGGIYVPVTEVTQPNPYLTNVPERDITTPSGKLLTLMNPAYMTRQVYELAAEKYGIRGHITSLNLIRPENAPDPWETGALEAFEAGKTEISSVEEIEGEDYMRLMRPLITEKGCLKCHAAQGYQEGDIRGGISFSVPMKPLEAIAGKTMLTLGLGHVILWLMGLGGIVLGTQRLRMTELSRSLALEALQQAKNELEIRVEERTADLSKSNVLLKEEITERKRAEEEIERFLHDMGERIKELTCLYGVADSIRERETLEEIFRDVAALIHPAWHYPEITRARLRFDKAEYVSEPFDETEWKQSSDIVVNGEPRGVIEVYYLEPRPELDEGPFLNEERNLIEGITKALSEAIGRKQAEEELKEYSERLEEMVEERTAQLAAANKELEAFSYSVSHDLRAPLRAIDGFGQALIEDCGEQLDDEGKRLLGIIKENARKMGQLIDDLLAFSRTGRKTMGSTKLDMSVIAKTVYEELNSLTSERKLRFEIKRLPSGHGDWPMMHQVWTNLLSNAIKFTGPVDNPEIEVGGRTEGDEKVYWVRDNGVGFDMKYADKLFTVFQRLHSAGEFEGTGVGLALVQRIIHRHGGRVWAEGKVGKGATFYFTLLKKEGRDQ